MSDKFSRSEKSIALASFYKPPADMTSRTAAFTCDRIIRTKKDETDLAALRSAGTTGPILQYIRGEAVASWDINPAPFNNQLAWDIGLWNTFKSHENWFLHHSSQTSAQRLRDGTSEYLYWNPGAYNAGLGDFIISTLTAYQATTGADFGQGVFGDNVHAGMQIWSTFATNIKILNGSTAGVSMSGDNVTGVFEYTTGASYLADIEKLWAYVAANIGDKWSIGANLTGYQYDKPTLSHLHAMYGSIDVPMDEGFSVDYNHVYLNTTRYLQSLQRTEDALTYPVSPICVIQGTAADPVMWRFAIASYLLVASSDSSFRYSEGSSYTANMLMHPYYTARLGRPKGPRYSGGTNIYKRDYEAGTVTVDASTHAVELPLGWQYAA